MNKLIKYVLSDILRSRVVLAYTVILVVLTFSVFSIEDNASKGILSMLNIILFIVPLVSLIFSTIYFYNSTEFIELLVSQPIRRSQIWISLFSGLSGALLAAYLIGAGIPVLIYAFSMSGLVLMLCGCLLTMTFVSLAVWASVRIRDKARGIGTAIMLWLFFALLFDAIVLFVLFQFSDYPIDTAMTAMAAINPIDLSRILILLQIDVSAMMGYTGAVFRETFGSTPGFVLALLLMVLWIVVPAVFSARYFKKKDL